MPNKHKWLNQRMFNRISSDKIVKRAKMNEWSSQLITERLITWSAEMIDYFTFGQLAYVQVMMRSGSILWLWYESSA